MLRPFRINSGQIVHFLTMYEVYIKTPEKNLMKLLIGIALQPLEEGYY